ncbi:ABC transporter substrate-binding protein [Desulfovibrio mangrovi]|uniref:substrate-binding periplasmic protein n=1 Tax=Desulfovibrio mangrovi TaxID=2976983 RepID=UPI0022459A79|nr:ABC transporter substrate-binding protein [Desulfovibrio mangrovi]UZP66443.1 ABC transporter substrate-binding protein [Desulfovibrio mangrovi]
MRHLFLFAGLLCLLVATCATAHATGKRMLRVASHDFVAPLVMPDKRTGLEVDIVREALQLEGYDMTLVFLPAPRMLDALTNGKVDAAFPLRAHAVTDALYLSDSHITFNNVAVSLEEANAVINCPSDLAKYNVEAFLGASRWLPEEFRTMARNNPSYAEQNDQQAQVCSFFARRDRVIVLEQHIFDYYAGKGSCNPLKQRYVLHDILDPAYVAVAFTERDLRDAFNRGLAKLKQSGRYEQIVWRYLYSDN